jgi:hypothetical protein
MLCQVLVCLVLTGVSTASDVIWQQSPVTVYNSSCTEFILPPHDLCSDCTVRRTTFMVEPHYASPSQVITTSVHGGSPEDTLVVVDNTGTGKLQGSRTSSGYLLCATGEAALGTDGFTTAMDVLLTLTPEVKPDAVSITQTWIQPDHLAAFVQINGVVADTAACINAGAILDRAQCMQLCTGMDTCTYFVRPTGSGCFLCTDNTISSHTWVLSTPGASVFLRGKQLHLFFDAPEHSVAIQQDAYPGRQKTLQSLFTILAVFGVTVFVYMGCYFDIASARIVTPEDPTPSPTEPPPPSDPNSTGPVNMSALGLDQPSTKKLSHSNAPLATQHTTVHNGVVYANVATRDDTSHA